MTQEHSGLPVDPDLAPEERVHGLRRAWHAVAARRDVLAVIAVGGAVGAGLRHGVSSALPRAAGDFPWATLIVNVTGCLALGALMVVLLATRPHARYLRPLLGVGLLGGWTTFSTYALEARDLLAGGHGGTAAAYLLGSVAAGLGAVQLGLLAGETGLALARRGRA